MKLNALRMRLQLLCYEHSEHVLQLLRVGGDELFNQRQFRYRIFAANKFHSGRGSASRAIDAYVGNRHFNGVRVSTLGREDARLAMLLDVSPNNTLWADTRQAEGVSLREEQTRQNFESRQVRVAGLGICHYPTALDCSVSLPISSAGTSSEQAKHWIITTLERARLEIPVIGGADILHGLVGETWSNMANNLDMAQGGTDQNRGRFDNLHDFMICSPALGARFAELAGPKLQVWPVKTGTHSLVILTLPSDPGWREHVKQVAKDLLAELPQEHTHIHPSDRPVYSKREYDKLDAQGKILRLPHDWILHSLLPDKLAAALGLDPEQMPVVPMQRLLATRIESECSEAIASKHLTGLDILDQCEEVHTRYLNIDYVHVMFNRLRQQLSSGSRELPPL